MSAHDRRGFFGELLRSVARVGAEVDEALGSWRDEREPTGSDADDDDFEVVDAQPAETAATEEDVRRLCDELGRPEWADEASAAASLSLRLTHGDGSSRLGGGAPLPPGEQWPTHDGEPLTLVLCLDLSELAPLPLSGGGTLLLFCADDAPEVSQVLVVGGGGPPASRGRVLAETPLRASRELVLPAVPRSLELDPSDLATWTRLRARLAHLQGVELEEQAADYHALHRLLGEPDLVAHAMDEEAARAEPRTEPGDWRLLLQVSSEPAVGFRLPAFERLYTWIPRDDLATGRLDRCRAFVA